MRPRSGPIAAPDGRRREEVVVETGEPGKAPKRPGADESHRVVRVVEQLREMRRHPVCAGRLLRGLPAHRRRDDRRLQRERGPDVVMDVVRHLVRQDDLDLIIGVIGQQCVRQQDPPGAPDAGEGRIGLARAIAQPQLEYAEHLRAGPPDGRSPSGAWSRR